MEAAINSRPHFAIYQKLENAAKLFSLQSLRSQDLLFGGEDWQLAVIDNIIFIKSCIAT